MYESLLRSPGDLWFTPDCVDWHAASRDKYVTQVKLEVVNAVREGRPAIKSLGPNLLKRISDSRLLREAWDKLAAKGETAPGPNGRRYDDYDDNEVWDKLKAISIAIRKDTFRPGGEREVQIPKDRTNPARGTRVLTLVNIAARVVQRAVIELLQPLFDSLFGRNILGFRPGLGRLHALALAEQQAVVEGRHVLVVEDLADAFDHVPIGRLFDVLAMHIPSADVLRLLRRLLDRGATHGIQQGGPLSPILLNVYLNHFLDQPWAKAWPSVPMIRVADDILLLCRTKKEAEQARAGLRELLTAAGMPLKVQQQGPVHDLRRGGTATWLGFMLKKGVNGFTVTIADKAWRRLAEYLTLAHEKPDSAVRATATINGWIDQMGPCYPFVKRAKVYDKLAALAGKLGFDEIPSRDAVTSRWRRAHQRWYEIRDAVRERPEVLDSAWAKQTAPGASGCMSLADDGDPEIKLQGTSKVPFEPD
ncbi:MAG: reverse transcriptase domain-containing protein [Planctomycetota bacterium]|nr:reverse transcriptase domain-containing protein [Planctomycetota bacterium]